MKPFPKTNKKRTRTRLGKQKKDGQTERSAQKQPRSVAFDFLVRWESQRGEIPLNREILKDPRDQALAYELIQGVFRHRLFLDWVIKQNTRKKKLPSSRPLLSALRLGCYQLLFLDRIPSYAAVNESVNLIKNLSGEKTAHFTNAVLRSVQRKGLSYFSDPKMINPLEKISIKTSHPQWMVKRWLNRWGQQRTNEVCEHNNQKPPITLQVNTLLTDREATQRNLHKEGIETLPAPFSEDTLYFISGDKLLNSEAYRHGLIYIQDEGSHRIAPLLSPKPGERILDACAAPGGKTIHLAQLMENEGEIVCLDITKKRLSLLKENLQRLDIGMVKPMVLDATKDLSSLGKESFHAVLVDAPCSGFGVLRRHPEGKWKKGEAIIPQYADLQKKILDRVAPLLKPGGRLVYSTCSTEPEENENTIERFLKKYKFFCKDDTIFSKISNVEVFRTPEGYFSTLFNQQNMDYFFSAVLKKSTGDER